MREKERNPHNFRRWCANQSNGFITPEHRKFRRAHGLQLPLHPQQVTGWIVISIIIINTFVVLTPHIKQNLRSILTTIVTGIFVTHICSHLIVLMMDPADPRVRSQPSNKILPEFDRNKHLHVIENGRCHLCNITTDNKRTKHCSICNKCIVRFDHHCKWLNNCIGARNYLAFLICLVSAILASLFVAGLSMTELTLSFFGGTLNYIETNRTMGNMTATIIDPLIVPVSDAATLIVIFTIGLLSAIVAILLLHLCFFHGYIACLGLTTYEYVRKKREKNSVATAVVIAAAAAAAAAAVPGAPAGGGSETATVDAGNTTTVAVGSNVVKLAEDTVHGNSSSISTVSNPTSGHDFSEISPGGYCRESVIQNNIDMYPVHNTQEQIIFGATSKSIVIQSLFSYCRNKREMTHFYINRYVGHPQLNESSRKIRTTVIEQSTTMAQNLTAELSIPSTHIHHSPTLYSITTGCCSGKNGAEVQKSKGRYSGNACLGSATDATKPYLAVERIQKRFRAYLNKGSDKTCKIDANASRQLFHIKLNRLGETMSEMNMSPGMDKTVCSENTESTVHSLVLLNEAPAIIESHSSAKLQTVQSTLITEPNQCIIGDYDTVRRRETFEPSAHDKYFATRFTSRKKATIKMSHMSSPAKLSPILESELSPPINTYSLNPLQSPASAHSMLFTYTPATPHLSHIESLSSMRSFIPRFSQSSSEI